MNKARQSQTCLFCGHTVEMVHVHGHYQCPVCRTNCLPCCDGDNCETNKQLATSNAAIGIETDRQQSS